MAKPHIWSLRLNLDKFNAAVAALGGDSEKVQFLSGLSRGMNGGTKHGGVSQPFLEGFEIGGESRLEAEDYRAKQGKAGQASALARLTKNGTAQPTRTVIEHRSNSDRTPVRTAPEPILNPLTDLSFHSDLSTAPAQGKEPLGLPVDPVLLTLPCVKGMVYHVTQATLDRWKEAFPDLDPLAEARGMKFWLEENPTRQKTHKGMGKFFSYWLGSSLEQFKMNQTNRKPSVVPERAKAAEEYMAQNAEFFGGKYVA